jgi:hypothetical protein
VTRRFDGGCPMWQERQESYDQSTLNGDDLLRIPLSR